MDLLRTNQTQHRELVAGNDLLTENKTPYLFYDWADPYGGYWDLGAGNGCELCRWDGNLNAPFDGGRWQFPNPTTPNDVTMDPYSYSCEKTRLTSWPLSLNLTPRRCYRETNLRARDQWGYDTDDRGMYLVDDKLDARKKLLYCAWIGNCNVDKQVSPDKNKPYTNGDTCVQPSWWSCRQGSKEDPFNTGLRYYWGDVTTWERWLDPRCQDRKGGGFMTAPKCYQCETGQNVGCVASWQAY